METSSCKRTRCTNGRCSRRVGTQPLSSLDVTARAKTSTNLVKKRNIQFEVKLNPTHNSAYLFRFCRLDPAGPALAPIPAPNPLHSLCPHRKPSPLLRGIILLRTRSRRAGIHMYGHDRLNGDSHHITIDDIPFSSLTLPTLDRRAASAPHAAFPDLIRCRRQMPKFRGCPHPSFPGTGRSCAKLIASRVWSSWVWRRAGRAVMLTIPERSEGGG